MRVFLLIIFCRLFFFSCDSREREKPDFDWLLGDWIRLEEPEGRLTKEFWNKKDSNMYEGLGITLEGNDTIFKENIRIHKVDTSWVLEVRGVHENPIDFMITKMGSASFTAENPQNEFPKIIGYSKEKGFLMAEVSDGEVVIDFKFRQSKKVMFD